MIPSFLRYIPRATTITEIEFTFPHEKEERDQEQHQRSRQKNLPSSELTFQNFFFCSSSSEMGRRSGWRSQVKRSEVNHAGVFQMLYLQPPHPQLPPPGQLWQLSSPQSGDPLHQNHLGCLLNSGSLTSPSSESDSLKKTLEFEFEVKVSGDHQAVYFRGGKKSFSDSKV